MRLGGGRRRPARTLIWQLLAEQRGWMAAAIGLSVVGMVAQIAVGQAAVAVIDQGVTARSASLGGLVLRMAILGLVHITLSTGGVLLMVRVRWTIEYRVRTVLHRSLIAGAVADDNVSTGQVVTRAVADLDQVKKVVYLVPIFVAGVPAVVAGMLYLGYLNVPLMLVTFSSLPVNLWLVRRVRPKIAQLSWLQLQETAEVTAAIDEPIRGIRVVKLFGREGDVVDGVRGASVRAYRYALTRVKVLARSAALLKMVPTLSQAALLLLGARAVEGGTLTTGQFLVFFVGSTQVVFFAQAFITILDQWMFAKTGSSRIGELVDPGGEGVGDRMVGDDGLAAPADPFGPARVGWACHDLVVTAAGCESEPLSFAVRPGEAVVLRVPAELSLAAMGELLTGGLAARQGVVWLEDCNLHDLPTATARTRLRVLDSEPYLFARSVRRNLLLGAGPAVRTGATSGDDDLDASAERSMERMLWAACADEVVATFADGLDEVLGDRAMNLSGGQRQRLALAQALLAEPRVLILLEALSGVHAAMEAEILQRIREASPETAVLYLTTRPSAGDAADRVERVRLREPELVAAHSGDRQGGQGDGQRAGQPAVAAGGSAAAGGDDGVLATVTNESPRCAPEAETVATAPTVPSLARAFRRMIPPIMLVMLVITLVGLTPQYLFGATNDAITAGSSDTGRFAVMLVALAAVGAIAFWWFEINAARLTNGMLYLLRVRLIRRLSRLGLAYYDRELPGYVATRVLHDLDEITTFAGAVATRLAVVGLTLVGAVIAMSIIGAQILAVIVGIILTALLVTAAQVPLARRAYLRERLALGDVIARLEEDYNGRAAIDAAGASGDVTGSFDELAEILRRRERWSAMVNGFYVMAINWLAEIGGALILWRAGELVLGGLLALGSMLTLRLYITQVLHPVMELGNLWQQYLRARISFDRLRQPYHADVLPVDDPEARECEALSGDLAFEGVAFCYPGTTAAVLTGTSFVLPEGATVAVVGPTGAGKSTIAKLATRVYDPDGGAVKVGSSSLRDFTIESVRSRIGVVPQEPFLFAGTVAGNVAYGRPDATREEIERAIEAVGATDGLHRLPMGLDTAVLEEGINLTPQERQLVALARAWIVQPDILVLDESTSALDEQTEALVLQALRRRAGTTIFITHRESVAGAADVRLVVGIDSAVVEGPAEVLAPT